MYHPNNGLKKLQTPNQACRENDAVDKYTRERTFGYAGAEKQTAGKVGFRHLSFFLLLLSHTKLLTSIAYKLKS